MLPTAHVKRLTVISKSSDRGQQSGFHRHPHSHAYVCWQTHIYTYTELKIIKINQRVSRRERMIKRERKREEKRKGESSQKKQS